MVSSVDDEHGESECDRPNTKWTESVNMRYITDYIVIIRMTSNNTMRATDIDRPTEHQQTYRPKGHPPDYLVTRNQQMLI